MDEQLAEFKKLLSEVTRKVPGSNIELLLREMESDAANCLRLAAIPHEFDASVLCALIPALTLPEAQERCEQFAKLSTVSKHDNTLSIHGDSRDYLFKNWLTQENALKFAEASRRLVRYFEAHLSTVDSVARSDIAEQAERNRMFHLLGANRTDGLAEFERLCRIRRDQLRLGECETLIKLAHEYDPALTAFDRAIVAYHEGKLAADRHQWPEAQQFFEQVLANIDISAPLRAKTLCRIGMINDAQAKWSAAIKFFEQGLEIARDRPDCVEQFIHLHLNLGSTYRDSGEFEKAKKFLNQGLALAEQAHNLSSLADGHNSLGNLYLRLNEPRPAIEAFERSLHYLDEAGDKFRSAQVFNNLGAAYLKTSDLVKSQEFFRRSLEIKRRAGDNSSQAMTLTNLAGVYRAQKDWPAAIQASEDAAKLFAEVRDDYHVGTAKRSLAQTYRAKKDVDLAKAAFQDAAEMFARAGAQDTAEKTRQEAHQLERTKSLPWWIIVPIVLLLLLLALIAIALLDK